MRSRNLIALSAVGLIGALLINPALAEHPINGTTVDFNGEIRPILSKNCFSCHGQDEDNREAGLRLDRRQDALKKLDSDSSAIVPGKPSESELIRRITTTDADLRMPPVDSEKKLSKEEIELIKRWIEQGAAYAKHWSFVKPKRWPLPEISESSWPMNAIDYFVLARLDKDGLKRSAPADRYILIRRLSLDVRGLPPTPDEVVDFVNDDRPDAYDRLVDRYLGDPAFGERWARTWLDLARYADSRGYGSDPLRMNMWRYRDWVIEALNQNLPYDQFTFEQLAGDLLPNPTLDQRIATAFHRNTMTNTEGGTDDEEFRVAAVKDRVDTTIQIWMGLTMRCANCHNHKYDPISQRDYYRFYAFFNQTADTDKPDEFPTIEAPDSNYRHQLKQFNDRLAELKRQLEFSKRKLAKEQPRNARKPPVGRYVRVEIPGKQKLLSLAEVQVFRGKVNLALKGEASQSSTDHDGLAKLAIDGKTDGHYFNAKSTTHTKKETNPWWEVDLQKPAAVDRIVIWNRTDNNLQTRLSDFRVLVLDTDHKPLWQQDIKKHPNPSSQFTPVPLGPAAKAVADGQQKVAKLEKSKPKVPTLPVMQELAADKRRSTHVMIRGNFLANGELVQPAVRQSFHGIPQNAPADRLGVAMWLMAKDNPLTARVVVNRFWAQLFGIGLVETEEDFGTQGEPPSHRRLLDWLASEFMSSGWDVKRLLRLIVTSSTYRQISRVTPELLRQDPRNRLLARGPRFRLEAETVRDQALALGGLLSQKMYGASVYPYQPTGLWRAAFNGQRKWPISKGEDRYRRGVYTFWRRTVPYPSMSAFDAPSREICTVRRIRTNTPLQAFVTLNDPVFVGASQALARRIVREGGSSVESRIKFALTLCLARPPQPEQIESITSLYQSESEHYHKQLEAAERIATQPLGPLPDKMEAAELAVWTVISNVLLNLDAVLTKN